MSFLMPIKKRGAVAIRHSDNSWTGVYKSDGAQPITFGPDIWERLQNNWKNLLLWGKDLLQYGYWNDYINNGLCPYCGKFGLGQPINMHLSIIHELNNGVLAPDINCKKHSHMKPMPCVLSQNEKADGLWIEWIYVINPKTYMLEVLKAVRDAGTHQVRQAGRIWEQPNYRYMSVGLFSLFDIEPNWEFVQFRGDGFALYYHTKYMQCQSSNFSNL